MRFRTISPDGKTYIIENGLDEFCNDHDLCLLSMLSIANSDDDYLGWKCTKLGD